MAPRGRLATLQPELLALIAEDLQAWTIEPMSLTCRSLRNACLPHLFRTATFRPDHGPSMLQAKLRFYRERPHLWAHVRSLVVRTVPSEYGDLGDYNMDGEDENEPPFDEDTLCGVIELLMAGNIMSLDLRLDFEGDMELVVNHLQQHDALVTSVREMHVWQAEVAYLTRDFPQLRRMDVHGGYFAYLGSVFNLQPDECDFVLASIDHLEHLEHLRIVVASDKEAQEVDYEVTLVQRLAKTAFATTVKELVIDSTSSRAIHPQGSQTPLALIAPLLRAFPTLISFGINLPGPVASEGYRGPHHGDKKEYTVPANVEHAARALVAFAPKIARLGFGRPAETFNIVRSTPDGSIAKVRQIWGEGGYEGLDVAGTGSSNPF